MMLADGGDSSYAVMYLDDDGHWTSRGEIDIPELDRAVYKADATSNFAAAVAIWCGGPTLAPRWIPTRVIRDVAARLRCPQRFLERLVEAPYPLGTWEEWTRLVVEITRPA